MRLSSLNEWLTLAANLGVIVSIIFLAFELRQSNENLELSNRIANYSSENARRNMYLEQNLMYLESPEFTDIAVKVSQQNVELTLSERIRARAMARSYLNIWLDSGVAYDAGLLSESGFRITVATICKTFEEYPGLVPVFRMSVGESPLGPDTNSITKVLLEELFGEPTCQQ